MNWFTVFENVGMFAIASGLLTWLIKELVTHSLSRDLEMFKAELAKAHAIQMEEAKNRFTVGAMSHMAIVAFDKHVQFCEEYTDAVRGALLTLLRRGPHEDVLKDANALSEIREKSSLWLASEVEAQLAKFEGALRKIGANAWLLKELRADEDRTDAIKEAFGTFAAVMGWEKWKGEVVTGDLAADRVLDGLRNVLGIRELTELRGQLVQRAMV
jgi:hypothetical protein